MAKRQKGRTVKAVKSAPASIKGFDRDRIIGFVCGVLSMFILPIILGPLAIYFGVKSYRKGDKLGIVPAVLGVVALLFVVRYILLPS